MSTIDVVKIEVTYNEETKEFDIYDVLADELTTVTDVYDVNYAMKDVVDKALDDSGLTSLNLED